MGEAVAGAVRVFRERGYHAASVGDLAAGTGLTAGSLYKAFADKRAIFLAAFDRYTGDRHAALAARLAAEPTGRAKVRAVLAFYAESSAGAEGRHGCLVAGTAAAGSTLDAEFAARATDALGRVEALLADLVRLGRSDRSIPASVDPAAVAGTLLCVVQGMRVVGKVGRTRAQASAVVEQAMRLLG